MPALDRTVSWRGPAASITSADEAIDLELLLFVRNHQPRLIRLAGLICREVADAEDAVQAALERAWRSRAMLQDRERLAGWLDRIVVNEAIRLERRHRPWLARLLSSSAEVDDLPARGAADPEGGIAARLAIRDAFAKLPPPQRAVVALHLYRGYSMAETARLLDVPLETARSRLRLARARLRVLLGEADA